MQWPVPLLVGWQAVSLVWELVVVCCFACWREEGIPVGGMSVLSAEIVVLDSRSYCCWGGDAFICG